MYLQTYLEVELAFCGWSYIHSSSYSVTYSTLFFLCIFIHQSNNLSFSSPGRLWASVAWRQPAGFERWHLPPRAFQAAAEPQQAAWLPPSTPALPSSLSPLQTFTLPPPPLPAQPTVHPSGTVCSLRWLDQASRCSSDTLFVCVFKHRGPIHSLRHLTSPRGPTRLHPGGPAPTLNPPESLTSSSGLHSSWWSTQVRETDVETCVISVSVSVVRQNWAAFFALTYRRPSGIPGQFYQNRRGLHRHRVHRQREAQRQAGGREEDGPQETAEERAAL